jgi:hypothetical protein
MLHNLLKTKTILDKNPKTNKTELLKKSGLSNEEFNLLLTNNIIQKRGKTKGAEWHWVGKKPDYDMIQSLMSSNTPQNKSMLEIIMGKYDVKVSITDKITLKIVSNDTVSLRREDGNEVVVNDPLRLKEILSLIS